MALLYAARRAVVLPDQQQAVVQAQRSWIRRRAECRDTVCLQEAYAERMRQLKTSEQDQQSARKSKPEEPAPVPERETVAYASRAGMGVTVISKNGIGSEDAEVTFVHTKADAKSECVEYNQDNSDACVAKVVKTVEPLNGTIVANCRTGIFTTVMGGVYAFAREHRAGDDPLDWGPELEIVDLGAITIMDGSSASGYSVALDNLKALCPVYGQRAAWIAADRSRKYDPSRTSDPGPSLVPPLADGTGPVQPEDFEIDLRRVSGEVIAVAGPIWCLSADVCVIASPRNLMINVEFATSGMPREVRHRLILCGPERRCLGAVAGLAADRIGVHLVARAVTFRQ